MFASIGLKCKAWAYFGEPAPSVVTMDQGSMGAAIIKETTDEWLVSVETTDGS